MENKVEVGGSIYSESNCGPTFGGGYDLFISSDSNQNTISYSNLGHSFYHPTLKFGSEQAKCFLGGSYTFRVSEIEVFTKVIELIDSDED